MQFLDNYKDCHCLLNSGVYYIFEDNNEPKFVKEEDKWNLRVNTRSNIDFFQIDDCVITDNKYKRVDWMFLNTETIYLVEVKDVNIKQYKEARSDAWRKLIGTFDFFEKNDYSTSSGRKIIYVLNLYSEKTNIIGRVRNSSVNTRKVKYKKEFGVVYEEGNSIFFE